MRLIKKLGLTAAVALSCFAALPADAQIYVNVRPRAPRAVVTRPVAPTPNHVWVEEDWRVRRGRYQYQGGHWVAPPRSGATWVPGHWKNTPRRGWVWKPGHWR